MTDHHDNFENAARDGDLGPIARADLAIADAAEPLADLWPIRALAKASELADQPPLVAATLAVTVAGIAARDTRLARAGLRMLTSHALATGLKTVAKNNVDRTRPRKVDEDGEHDAKPGHSKDGDYRSFPSGHTAGAVAVARAVTREYPGGAGVAYTAAATAALVQIPKKAHFASDVIVGAAIGLLSERMIDRIVKRLLR
ncbi:phosphatase PAP2 family protein [uncultured Croceicoccus sp.]|uniref:phosphatase PAP2 family protein n=1 Tax=uncultured Croceicoccus sp. TaxID=1295329 RepID=UPI00261ACFD1|nr:phosphatase PAP2 family protein [uncultured Croceicoccus sp.]